MPEVCATAMDYCVAGTTLLHVRVELQPCCCVVLRSCLCYVLSLRELCCSLRSPNPELECCLCLFDLMIFFGESGVAGMSPLAPAFSCCVMLPSSGASVSREPEADAIVSYRPRQGGGRVVGSF